MRVLSLASLAPFLLGVFCLEGLAQVQKPWEHGKLVVADNRRFLRHDDGTPFFWLGDTAWRLLQRLDRREVETYFTNRRRNGFNVVQVVAAWSKEARNAYDRLAFTAGDMVQPAVTSGNNPEVPGEYDFWDHLDYAFDRAADNGIYIALLPVWGSLVKGSIVNEENAGRYASWLAARYRSRPNLIWVNGGDARGNDGLPVWQLLGRTIRESDPAHLVTYHPFGGTSSSAWFHNEPWLDFNMFQSGHRRYDQVREEQRSAQGPAADLQTSEKPAVSSSRRGSVVREFLKSVWKGEDGWRYVEEDLAKTPPKPTLDGEPSYESIPQGLHDPTQPFWQARDCRRYAYWAVFAGAFGHTYGHNAVMQMHEPGAGKGAYGVREYWLDALDAPGAGQMQFLKKLMLSRPFFERVPDQSVVAGQNGERYERVIATRGEGYLFAYSYTGRPFEIRMGVVSGNDVVAWWFNPRDGSVSRIGRFKNQGARRIVPPGTPGDGNDWVLVIDDASRRFPAPGS